MRKLRPDMKRGPMSDAERAEIDSYAEIAPRPSPSVMAHRLNRCHGTVFWYMLNKGYLKRELRYEMKPYRRGGRMVYPFTREEDLRLLALRVEGKNPREIADILTEEFGIERIGHSIDVRLKFLAAYENSSEEMAA